MEFSDCSAKKKVSSLVRDIFCSREMEFCLGFAVVEQVTYSHLVFFKFFFSTDYAVGKEVDKENILLVKESLTFYIFKEICIEEEGYTYILYC